MRARLALGAAGALVLAGFVWRLGGSDPAGPPGDAPASGTRAAFGSEAPPATAPALPPLPASLAGTGVDGDLRVDGEGRFVATPDAIDLFDYFLAASGEESLALIRARIEREIETRLPPDARADARDLLERYLAYREALREEASAEGLAEASLEQRFQRIRELRRGWFDAAEREALFAAEEERWRVDLERRRVATDPGLTAEERARRLAALDAELPAEIREGREAALAATRLRRDEASLRDRGASDAEIDALREERFGREAADRLAELDRRRSDWDRRMARWLTERDRLEAAGIPPQEIAAQRALRFQGPELQRVLALERIQDAG